jgi:hypothetical protein
MGRMSDLHLELSEMTTQELEQAYVALKYSPSKSVRDEVMQEMLAQMLDQRETENCSPFATINS